MKNIEIRVLEERDWQRYKTVRLASLLESPDAFGSSHERESSFAESDWVARFSASTEASMILPLIAELDGVPVGLAWGRVHKEDVQTVYVYQMWVSPTVRGLGVGRCLLSRVINWAVEADKKTVSLAVTTTNIAAMALYSTAGFVNDGEPEALRPGSHLLAQNMVLELSSNVNDLSHQP